MKSVIAQGTTVVKAVEEALKKADMPVEFFVKLLEDAQSGFLGFGAKKAKVALFFKQSTSNSKKDGLLNQESYENLFDSDTLRKQIEQQIKEVDLSVKPSPVKVEHQKQNITKQQTHKVLNKPSLQSRPVSETLKNNNTQRSLVQQPKSKSPINSVEPKEFESKTKVEQQDLTAQPKKANHNYRRRRRSGYRKPADASGATPAKSLEKLVVRPLPIKNNDSSKS